jgi:ppGpp synthetase/RelA/SpoT-type nucleotidyltranferase
MTTEEAKAWLEDILARHARLTPAVSGLLENILTRNSIEYLSIAGRTKDAISAEEKIRRKKYTHPRNQLTDLSGIRVITFLETQVNAISELIRKTFDVDEANSLDRSKDLGEDKMGYRSTHFVCTLGKNRVGLPEYDALGDLKFEVQVRTVLQHAWAELAHDRSFKLGSGLPTKIQRKLNLYSGMLEIVDGAFDEIAREVDEYKVAIATKTPTQLSDTELNSLSLQRYLRELTEQHDLDIEFVEIPDGIMTELKLYGIQKIGDLKLIADAKTLNKIRDFSDEAEHSENLIGFVRTLMMYHDIDRYFTVWRRWTGLDVPTANLLKEKYGQQKLGEILSKFHIAMEGEEHEDSDDDDIPQ